MLGAEQWRTGPNRMLYIPTWLNWEDFRDCILRIWLPTILCRSPEETTLFLWGPLSITCADSLIYDALITSAIPNSPRVKCTDDQRWCLELQVCTGSNRGKHVSTNKVFQALFCWRNFWVFSKAWMSQVSLGEVYRSTSPVWSPL